MTKQEAYRKVRSAIATGKLKRPRKCQRCGQHDIKCSDGRTRIQAHHHDYSKPLDVEWICIKCHAQITPRAPTFKNLVLLGESNGFAKLNNKLVLKIIKSKKNGVELAKELNLDSTTIYRVRRGESWTHVTGLKNTQESSK